MTNEMIKQISELKCESREDYMIELSKITNIEIRIANACCVSSSRGVSHTHKILKSENAYCDFKTKKNELVEVTLSKDDEYTAIIKRRGKWCYRTINRETREFEYTLINL